MEKLVLIHVTDSEYRKIQNIASRMKITVDRIPDEIVTTNYKLGELVNGTYKKAAEMADATDQTGKNAAEHSSSAVTAGMQTKSRADSLILLCNLKEKRLDKMLFELRHGDVKVDYKAILTPSNQNWTVKLLMQELRKERFVMMRK